MDGLGARLQLDIFGSQEGENGTTSLFEKIVVISFDDFECFGITAWPVDGDGLNFGCSAQAEMKPSG